MNEAPAKSPKKLLIGCACVFLVALILVCLGPRVLDFFHDRSIVNEFQAHREYYESLVLQLENERLPPNREYFYAIPEDRYSGNPKRIELDGPEGSFNSVMSGHGVWASTWNGVLVIRIALRRHTPLLLPEVCGVAYCSGEMGPPGAEEWIDRIEPRWWLWSISLAK